MANSPILSGSMVPPKAAQPASMKSAEPVSVKLAERASIENSELASIENSEPALTSRVPASAFMELFRAGRQRKELIEISKPEEHKLSSLCAICGSLATSRCSKCQQQHYCSREHQILHWNTHKLVCNNYCKQNRVSEGNQSPGHNASSASTVSATFPSELPFTRDINEIIEATGSQRANVLRPIKLSKKHGNSSTNLKLTQTSIKSHHKLAPKSAQLPHKNTANLSPIKNSQPSFHEPQLLLRGCFNYAEEPPAFSSS